MDSIRIEISGNAEALKPTVDKLKEIGAVDKKNAEQFKVTNKEFEHAAEKRAKLLADEIQDLEELKRAKKAAYSPEDLRAYEKSIKDSTERIRLLSAETNNANNSMAKVVTTTNNLGESVKKSYGLLRTMANIIPGIGISGLILAGYEALLTLIQEMTSSFEDSTEAIKFNNQALEKQIEKQAELQGILEEDIQNQLLLKGQISEADKLRFKAEDDFNKRDKEIQKDKIKYIEELAVKYKMSAEDFKQYSSRIQQFGKITAEQSKAIQGMLALEDTKGLSSDLDTRLSIVSEYISKLEEYDIRHNAMVKANEEDLNVAVGNIQTKSYLDTLKKKKESVTKIKDVEDEWWKWYLKMWKEAFDKSVVMYKKDTDDFIKEQKRKFDDAVKRSDDNINLIIDDMQLEASLTQDKTDDENAAYQERLNNFKIQYDEQGKITEESQRHLELLLKQHNQNLLKIQYDAEMEKTKKQEEDDKKREKKRKEDIKNTINDLKTVTDAALKQIEIQLNANIDAIDRKEELQVSMIDKQRDLASKGLSNDLAFEEKRQAELERQRMQEKRKLMKLKELEVFLNSVSSFSKDDPKSAIGKALAELALVRGVEASFAEEGGLLGQIKEKSWQGRKHKGGGDILVHAQTGEGILSRADISNMGGEQAFLNFKNMLGNNSLPQIPMSGVIFQGMNTKKLEDKLDNLEKALKNKKEVYVDWESHGIMNVTTVENGIRETVKHIMKKPRI